MKAGVKWFTQWLAKFFHRTWAGLEITNKNKNGTEIWAKSRLEMEFGKNLSLGFITWIYLFSSFFGALLKYGEIEHMERQNSLITSLC